jgi:hypothetical protein
VIRGIPLSPSSTIQESKLARTVLVNDLDPRDLCVSKIKSRAVDEIHIISCGCTRQTKPNGDEDVNQCPLTSGQRSTLTNDAAPPPVIGIGNAAPPSRVSGPRNALTHEHARPSCGLKNIINTLNFQRRAFLVGACTDRLCDMLCLRPRNISVDIRVITRWAQVCLAADEDYRDDRTTYGPYFFDPLIITESVMMISLTRANLHLKAAYLDSNVLQ